MRISDWSSDVCSSDLFAEACFDEIGIDKAPGLISRAMFALPGMTKDLAARNIIGIMLGATPPTLGNLQGIFYDWLHERTLWRHQAALRRAAGDRRADYARSEEHTSELQSLMRISYAVFCLKKQNHI